MEFSEGNLHSQDLVTCESGREPGNMTRRSLTLEKEWNALLVKT